MPEIKKQKANAFWKSHPYLEIYVYFGGYGMLYLGPICLIGGLIEYGFTTDALIPILALTIIVVGWPLILIGILFLFCSLFS